jgi:hypothetical protein
VVKGEGGTVRNRVFEGKCYNFALGFVEDRLLERGHWTPEKAMAISDALSKKVQRTVNNFFRKQVVDRRSDQR